MIVVTGTRLAEARALQSKRSDDRIIEALYANDVGKLPDQNVAEAVKRLPASPSPTIRARAATSSSAASIPTSSTSRSTARPCRRRSRTAAR